MRAHLDAAPFFEYRLPEHFAGFDRHDPEAPGVVPSSARPQAWAAGTPLLLLRAELGLEPDPDTRALRVTDGRRFPAWIEGLVLDGVPAFGRRWRVRVENGVATVEPTSLVSRTHVGSAVIGKLIFRDAVLEEPACPRCTLSQSRGPAGREVLSVAERRCPERLLPALSSSGASSPA